MFLAAVLVDATHSAFEQRKETFRRVHMNVVANVLFGIVFNAFVRGKFLPTRL